MWRRVHSFTGLWGMVLITVLSVSGAALSVYPAIDSITVTTEPTPGDSVADLLAKLNRDISSFESLARKPSGALVAKYIDAKYIDASEELQQVKLDAHTGAVLEPLLPPGPVYTFMKELHRSLFLDDTGRAVSGFGALLMAVLCIGGTSLLISRMGGLKRLFSKVKGQAYQRYHTLLARVMVLPLLLSSLTGLYLVLTDFELLSVSTAESLEYPQSKPGQPPLAPARLQALADIPLQQLMELKFPMVDDPADVFTATTSRGLISIDQYSGEVLEFVPATTSEIIFQWIYALHTGEGLALTGLFLGFIALLVPIMSITGIVTRWQRDQGSSQNIKGNDRADAADIVVLVGSERGASWGFARSLHRELSGAGYRVHVDAMNAFTNRYGHARHVLFLTSTYGNGTPPESAQRFHTELAKMDTPPDWSYAILGFGDRAFPHFCQFSRTLDRNLQDKGWLRAMDQCFINRQSTQAFTHWGNDLARMLGIEFNLNHQIALPKTDKLSLIERTLYGENTEAATVILRFRVPGSEASGNKYRFFSTRHKHPRFTPGDLLGILPPNSCTPRYYSIASKPSDSEVEICVKQQTNGICSTYLHQLSVGKSINYFNQANTDFQPVAGNKPIIMVSAGTGIAPFMGMIRANDKQRAIHFFWGGRDPDIDFLYQSELKFCERQRLLTSRQVTFSRVEQGCYVQTKIREDAEKLYGLLKLGGASVMVCGGDAMAKAVANEFNEILQPLGLNIQQLKARGQYLEDIF